LVGTHMKFLLVFLSTNSATQEFRNWMLAYLSCWAACT
jgi:hypothetical protein